MGPLPAIVFFHVGGVPRYLYATLESARFFNPEAPIFLIADRTSVDLSGIGIKVRSPESLQHPKLPLFLERYVHLSANEFHYERNCIARWFHIEQLLLIENCTRAVYLDSDAMLFHSAAELFQYIPEQTRVAISKASGPALTMIQHGLEPLLDLILAKYEDHAFLDDFRVRSKAAIARGQMDNITDMNFLNIFATRFGGLGTSYRNTLPIGHIDHCIFSNPDGILSVPNRRHRSRKRIFWEDVGGVFRPSFRSATDGHVIPALAVHFQNGAKRWIRRFNRVGPDSWVSRGLRLRYYNFLLN